MRSLVSWIAGSDRAGQWPGRARPEALRRHTLAVNARLILAVTAAGLPVVLYLYIAHGMLLPFVLDVLGLAVGFSTLALHRGGQYERAAAGQVYGTMVAGAVLAVADPAIADFGLALALLGPILASLLTRAPGKRRSWAGLAIVVGLAALATGGLPLWPEAYRPEYGVIGGVAFLIMALLVAHSANRLNSVFEVHEKAQISTYRHLIENVRDAVLSFAADGSLLFASRSAEALFGCKRYELAGTGVLDRIHVMDRPTYLTAYAAANVDGRATTVEIRMRHDDPANPAPRYAWIEMALSPVLEAGSDEESGRNDVVALLRDVTARRDQEAEMQRAREAAEEASSAKSHFLATIGHELRTPLNAIVGFSEMMSSGVAGEMAPVHREYAGLIHQSGLHLIEVVNMLLDVSRIEAGKFELQTDTFAPEGLVDPCLHILDPLARERRVRIVTDFLHPLPQIVADERACRQVLINLLTNAIKFSPEAAVVTLGMRRQGQHLRLTVADSGVGMDAASVRRIGEPFFQAHGGLNRQYEGTGLGLSIVKGLVELHDGTLHVTSRPGEGTLMTVLLPINGPATKIEETGAVTPLHRESAQQRMPEWQDERKRAL